MPSKNPLTTFAGDSRPTTAVTSVPATIACSTVRPLGNQAVVRPNCGTVRTSRKSGSTGISARAMLIRLGVLRGIGGADRRRAPARSAVQPRSSPRSLATR